MWSENIPPDNWSSVKVSWSDIYATLVPVSLIAYTLRPSAEQTYSLPRHWLDHVGNGWQSGFRSVIGNEGAITHELNDDCHCSRSTIWMSVPAGYSLVVVVIQHPRSVARTWCISCNARWLLSAVAFLLFSRSLSSSSVCSCDGVPLLPTN